MAKNILFVMRWPEEKGHMGDRVRASYEQTARILESRSIKAFIAYPNSVTPKKNGEALIPIMLDCFDLKTPANFVKIYKFTRENNIKFIFYIDPYRQWLAIFFYKILNIKTVYYCRYGYPPYFEPSALRQSWKWLYHRLNFWNHYIAISSHIRDCFVEREMIPPHKISIVRNGLNSEEFNPKNRSECPKEIAVLPRDSLVILSVAQIRPEKRIDNFIRVASAIIGEGLGKNIYFIHIGNGPALQDYQNQLVCLGIDKKVLMLGKRLNVMDFMSYSDILLHTSEKEGLCNVIGEAMLMELPVVASKIGGNTEQIQDGVTGYLNDIDDVEGFVYRIRKLILNESLRSRMGTMGRRRIIEKFTISSQVQGLISCVDILNRDSVP